jgi:hypothetical protein
MNEEVDEKKILRVYNKAVVVDLDRYLYEITPSLSTVTSKALIDMFRPRLIVSSKVLCVVC